MSSPKRFLCPTFFTPWIIWRRISCETDMLGCRLRPQFFDNILFHLYFADNDGFLWFHKHPRALEMCSRVLLNECVNDVNNFGEKSDHFAYTILIFDTKNASIQSQSEICRLSHSITRPLPKVLSSSCLPLFFCWKRCFSLEKPSSPFWDMQIDIACLRLGLPPGYSSPQEKKKEYFSL